MLKNIAAILSGLLLLNGSLLAQSEEKDFATADSLINKEQFDKAVPYLDKLISTYGEKEKFLTNRGFAYMQLNNVAKAKADYEKALTLNPGCAKCHGNLGIIESGNGNLAGALDHTEQYIRLEPAKAMGYVKRGEIRFQLGKLDEALADFNKGLEIDVNSPYILLWRSLTKLSQGNAQSALEDINSSIQYQPTEYAYYVRGKCYISLQQYQAAWDNLKISLQKNPNFSEYHTYGGIALYYLNEPAKSLQAFNQSIALDANNYLPYRYRSYLQYDMGKFNDACKDKQKAIDLLKASNEYPEVVKEIQDEINNYCAANNGSSYYHYGSTLFNLGNFEGAANAFDEGLKKFSTDALLYEGRGNAAMGLGRFREALTNYYLSLQNSGHINITPLITAQNPSEKNATAFFMAQLYNSISFAQVNLGLLDSAVLNLDKAIGILKENPAVNAQQQITAEYLAKKAMFYSLQQKYKEAMQNAEEALKMDPACVTAYINRATILINKNTLEGDKEPETVFQPKNLNSLTYTTTPSKNWKQEEIQAAVKDCDAAISIEPNNINGYMIRAQAKIILKRNDYCADVLKAKSLGLKDAATMLGVTCN